MKLSHVANPMQQSEIEVATFAGDTVKKTGYARTTNPDQSRFGLTWVEAGQTVNRAHVHQLAALTPADLEQLG